MLIAFGNDVMTRYAYDARTFRLLRQRSEKYTYSLVSDTHTYTPGSGTNRQDDGFNFDLVGNIMKILIRVNDCGITSGPLGPDALDREFIYDPLYRVTSGNGRESDTQNENDYLYNDAPAPGNPNADNVRAYTRQYSYDKIGNVQQVLQPGATGFTRNFVYNTGVNTLQKIETGSSTLIQDFTYDAVGNQITAGTTRNYVWNAGNQLITYYNQAGMADPTIFAQYDYSGMNRVSKMVRTGTAGSPIYERTIYIDGIFEYHILENGTTYEKNYVHVMDDQSRIAMVRIGTPFPDDITDAVTYNLEDQIGSSTIRLKTTGAVIDKEEYYPFGDSSLRTFSKKRYRYVGKEKDLESGLYYYGARYYAAWTCRFISCDPASKEYSNLSPYNYVRGNPIILIDPDGKRFKYAGKDKKEHKALMRELKKESKTFRKMYRSMKFSFKEYTITTNDIEVTKHPGSHYDPSSRTLNIDHDEKNISGYSVKQATIHEFGHGWRQHKGLTIGNSDSPYDVLSPENSVFLMKRNQMEETEGLHIENIIRSEINDDLREEYGTKVDNSALNIIVSKKTGTRSLDFTKNRQVMIKKDPNYEYKSNKNHYKNIKTRKLSAHKISIFGYSN